MNIRQADRYVCSCSAVRAVQAWLGCICAVRRAGLYV